MTTIETTEQAEALPVGTVLLDSHNLVYVRGANGDDRLWDRPGRRGGTCVEYIGLPAAVLHNPAGPAQAAEAKQEKRARKIEKLERKLERVTEDIRRHAGRSLPFELEREGKR